MPHCSHVAQLLTCEQAARAKKGQNNTRSKKKEIIINNHHIFSCGSKPIEKWFKVEDLENFKFPSKTLTGVMPRTMTSLSYMNFIFCCSSRIYFSFNLLLKAWELDFYWDVLMWGIYFWKRNMKRNLKLKGKKPVLYHLGLDIRVTG